jgi:hypothetical protein
MTGQLLLSAALLATAALAQAPGELPTGSRLAKRPLLGPTMTAKDQATGAKRVAECLYNRKTALARAALLAPTKEAADSAAAKLKGNVQCFGVEFSNDMVEQREVSIPPDIMRGMLAEAALQRSRSAVDALQALPRQNIYQRDWYVVTGRHVTVDEMGTCIADTNPAGTAALLRTEPVSKEEGAAFAALTDNLGQCLRIGTKLQASRQALRAALADALFQRLYRPAPSAEAAKP